MHVRFSRASADELIRILKLNLSEFEDIRALDIDPNMEGFAVVAQKEKWKSILEFNLVSHFSLIIQEV
jgi:hypothetical protein